MIPTPAEAALALSQSAELAVLTKVTVIIVLGLITARLAARGRAAVRHLLLAVTFAASLAIPLVMNWLPDMTIDVPVAVGHSSLSSDRPATQGVVAPTPTRTIETGTESRAWRAPSWASLARSAWIGGALIVLGSLLTVLWRLRRIRITGLPWTEVREFACSLASERGIRGVVDILQHEDVPAPFTFGVRHPVVVMPVDAREWSHADLRRALIHELEHIKRGDWAVQIVARVACACYWFHPLVWVAWRQLALEAERSCDDAVVARAEGTDYAEQLVVLARRMSPTRAVPTLGMSNRSDLSARVSALLDGSQRRGRAGLVTAVIACSVATLVVFAIAPVRAVATVRETDVRIANTTPVNSGEQPRRQRGLDRELYEAAESGDVEGVEELLQAGANVNAAIAGDGSPMIAAARAGRMAVARLLLDRGADPNMGVGGDGSPLIVAAGNGLMDMVRLLLERGADPNVGVRGDGSPLIAAAGNGFTSIVSLLLERGAQIDLVVPGDENALIQASAGGHLSAVRLLVERGADVNMRVWADQSGPGRTGEWRTPLSQARRGGHAAIVAFLLSAGASQ